MSAGFSEECPFREPVYGIRTEARGSVHGIRHTQLCLALCDQYFAAVLAEPRSRRRTVTNKQAIAEFAGTFRRTRFALADARRGGVLIRPRLVIGRNPPTHSLVEPTR